MRLRTFVSEHPVLTVFLVALAARVVLAVAIALGWDGTLFPDDTRYYALAAEQAGGDHSRWLPYDYFLYERTGALLGPITALFWAFGAHAILGQLWVALVGAGAAAVTTRLALEFLPRAYALAAGGIVALLPSQVLWSSIMMKDASVWLALSGLALSVALILRGANGRRLGAAAFGAVLALVALGFLRHHTLVVACFALVIASFAGVPGRRSALVVAALLVTLTAPWIFGEGPAGWEAIQRAGNLAAQRAANARNAASGVVNPRDPLKDEEFSADLSYLPEGLAVIALRPFPWEQNSSQAANLARAETPLWYLVLGVALVGLAFVRRRHLSVLLFPLMVGAATLVTYALSEGNIGTAFRHRGELVWVLALLAGLGSMRVIGWVRGRRAERAPAPA